MPAALPMMQEIVKSDQLVDANATADMFYEMGTIIGMGISGFLIYYLGIMPTLLIGGVLFILASMLNLLMSYQKSAAASLVNFSLLQVIKDYLFAVRYLADNRHLISVYLIQMLIMVILMTIPVLLLPFVEQVLLSSTKEFAILEALISIGMVLGGIFAPLLYKRTGIKITLTILLSIMSAALLIFAFNTNLMIAYTMYLAVGFSLSSWAIIISHGQLLTQNEIQGRLQASFYSLSGVLVLVIYGLLAYVGSLLTINHIYLVECLIAGIAILLAIITKLK